MKPELVIFDCDGVLVDSEPVTDALLADSLTKHGLSIGPSEVHQLFAGGTIAGVAKEAARSGAELPKDWIDTIYADIFEALRQGVPVIDGVIDLIHACDAAGIKRAIASNGPIEKMQISLHPSGLLDLFKGRIYSGHDHGPKPKPDMLLKIIDDTGADPAATVMIDDMPAGFNAAKAAGVTCFGYVADGDPARVGTTGAQPVTQMDQIRRALGI